MLPELFIFDLSMSENNDQLSTQKNSYIFLKWFVNELCRPYIKQILFYHFHSQIKCLLLLILKKSIEEGRKHKKDLLHLLKGLARLSLLFSVVDFVL